MMVFHFLVLIDKFVNLSHKLEIHIMCLVINILKMYIKLLNKINMQLGIGKAEMESKIIICLCENFSFFYKYFFNFDRYFYDIKK